jgi:Acetyltransferase (GNAT) domain
MSAASAVATARRAPLEDSTIRNVPEWCPIAPEAAASQCEVRVATSVREIEVLRPAWKRWAHTLETDIDYFLHRVKQDPAVLWPCVMTVYNNGIAQAMLVGLIKRQRASSIVSFVTVPGPMVKTLEIKKGGRMGRPSPVLDRIIAAELLKSTKRGEVDSICLERLSLHCGLFREIQKLPGFLVKQRVPHIFRYSILSLNSSRGDAGRVFSGKQLREVRRKTRNVERAFPGGQVTLKCFSGLGELDAGMCDAMRVAVTTWQYYMGLGLTDTARTRETLRFFARQGWLRIYVLYIADVPCAFLVGQVYNDTFHCQFAGYHPNYTRYSVGSLITARAFQDLAAAGVRRVDLGEGGQEHNRRLGCQMSEEGTVHIYSPTLRGLCLNLFFGTAQVVRAAGSRTRSVLRLARMSRLWSHFLLSRRAARAISSDVPGEKNLHQASI